KRMRDTVDHVAGSADETLGDLPGLEERAGERPYAGGIQPPVVDLHLLRLAAHDEVQRQPVEVAVLQGEQLLQAHRARHAPVAVEEDDTPRGTGLEPAARDR